MEAVHDTNETPTSGEYSAVGNPPVLPDKKYYLICKEIIERTIAFIVFILLLIPMLIVGLILKISEPGAPIIFKQKRVGQYGKEFEIYKFRTMSMKAPKYCSTSEFKDAKSYITPVGRILRSTSIDELPQLWNVIKGDMALIGPRPLIPSETVVHEMRHYYSVYDLKPGITGYAQVNGRDCMSDPVKVLYDSEYRKDVSFKLDLNIFFKSVCKVLKREGISSEPEENTGTTPDKLRSKELILIEMFYN